MSIVAAEMIWRESATNDNTSLNGGRMVKDIITDGVKNNAWPDVSQAERTTGSETYRKVHCHIANDADLQLLEARIFVERFTPGDDAVTIFLGDSKDTEATITGTEQQFGCGDLNATVLSGVNQVEVLTEDANLEYFKAGMKVRISDMANVDDSGNNQEYVVLDIDATYVSDVATLTFTPNLANGYNAANTRVASVIQGGTIEATATTPVVTAAVSGVFDDTYLTMDSIGTIEQFWTLTFTSATAYDIVGDTVLAQGGGTTGGASPANDDYVKPYFVITTDAFSGTWQTGDTITFTTSPAVIPVWMKRTIPPLAASLSANSVHVAVDGESA